MSKYRSLLFNKEVSVTVLIRVVTLILGFLTSIISARFLGPSGRGEYFFIITFATIISQFGNLGLASSNTYYVAKNHHHLNALTINSLWISLVIGSLSAVMGLIIWFTTNGQAIHNHLNMLITIILAPAMIFYLLAGNLFIGVEKVMHYNFYQLLSNLLVTMLLIFIGFVHADVNSFILAVTCGWLLTDILMFISLRKLAGNMSFKFNMQLFKIGLAYALKIYMLTLLSMLVLRSSILVLQSFSTSQELGYFSIASQLNDTMVILPTTVGMLLFPKLVKFAEEQWRETKANLYLMTGLMLIICLTAGLLTKPFIEFAFGEKYVSAINIFYYLLPSIFFCGLTSIVSQYLCAIGVPFLQIFYWIVAFILVNIFNLILIPRFGSVGAAISLSMTYTILFFFLMLLAITQSKNKEELLTVSMGDNIAN